MVIDNVAKHLPMIQFGLQIIQNTIMLLMVEKKIEFT